MCPWAALLVCYFGCVWLTRSHFGRVCVAIRENETRAELLGYDSRLYKLGLFSVGGGLAAIGGVLVANGIGRVTPDLFNLTYAAQAIIWVIVGGRGTLLGPVLGAFGMFWLTSWLGTQSYFNSNMVLGLVLILFVLLLPRGVVPAVTGLAARWGHRKVGRRESDRVRGAEAVAAPCNPRSDRCGGRWLFKPEICRCVSVASSPTIRSTSRSMRESCVV